MLAMAQENGVIEDAEAIWRRIIAAVPTANPASAVSYIHPEVP